MKPTKRKKRNNLEVSDEKVCEALTRARGYQSDAARLLDKSDGWMSERCTASEMIQAHLRKIGEARLDEYEKALDDLRDKKNPTSIIFYLKTKGRHRGYIEHAPIEDVDAGKLKVLGEFFQSIGARFQPSSKSTLVDTEDLDSSQEQTSGQATSASKRISHFP